MKFDMLKRIIITILVINIGISMVGCHTNPTANTSEVSSKVSETVPSATTTDLGFKHKINRNRTIEDSLPMAQPNGGLGLSLFDKDGNAYSSSIINMNHDLNLFLTLYSYESKKISYKLIQCIDFNQTAVNVDSNSYENGFDFTMPPNSIADIPLTFNIAKPGLHEVLLIFVISVNNKSMDEDYRHKTNVRHLLTYRLFLNVNEQNSIVVPPIQYLQLDYSKKSNLNGVLLNKEKDALSIWLTDIVKPSTKIPCFLHIGSAHQKGKMHCAIMLFNEWNQVKLGNNENVIFLELDPDKETIIPETITMPEKEGIYDVTPIIVYSPYDTEEPGPVIASFRTGIQVSASEK